MSLSFSRKNPQSLNQNGFTVPVVAIFVLAFLVAPVIFFYSGYRNKFGVEVKGASFTQQEEGVYIQVVSKAGSWDLSEYLCKSKEECEKSLDSGKKWHAVSGGTTEGSTIKINHASIFDDFGYIKVFVESSKAAGITAKKSHFTLNNAEAVTKIGDTNVLILSVSDFKSNGPLFFTFSDEL